jgi:hypothetical protein
VKFKIESGVEMPLKRSGLEFPLGDMKVGDSFLIPATNAINSVSAAQALRNQARKLKIGIVTRSVPEGIRVWKTSNRLVKPNVNKGK